MNSILKTIPNELETERLRLRAYKAGDGEWLHAIYKKDKSHFAQSIEQLKAGLGVDMTNPNDAELFVRRLTADWIMRRRFVFGSWQKQSGDYVGELWIECQNWDAGHHEIGYFVVSDHLQKGFATEAAKAGLRFVFDMLQAKKAGLTCDEDNIASYRVAERCGFVREGLLRAETMRPDGTLVGKYCYGMLRSEFDELYNGR